MTFLYVLMITLSASLASAEKIVRVCYYTNWAQYRTSPMEYFPENVDVSLCTHIIYAFAKIENHELKSIEWNDDKMFKKFREIQQVSYSTLKDGMWVLNEVGENNVFSKSNC